MKRYLPQIITATLIVVLIVGVFGFVAHAQGPAGGSTPSVIDGVASFFGLNLTDFLTQMVANLVNMALSIMGWFVALGGAFLNISINLTLNISAFVENTEAIFTTWTAIRDISSLVIIFFLLYAAIMMITGIQNPGFAGLIRNIVIAGVLINFSFFLTSLGIDASNIVSAQLYRAIAPASSLNEQNIHFQDQNTIDRVLRAGGLSDLFMQSLQITSVYSSRLSPDSAAAVDGQVSGANQLSAPLKIILVGITGVIIEFTAAISFFLASIAFIIRFVILIVLLAFSPIWFASHIIPQLKEYADKWKHMYYGMLIFMPVYLLLMYLALNVLTSSTIFKAGYAGDLVAGAAGANWYSNFIMLGVNAFIVIFLLNMPLVVAMRMGSSATSFIDKKWTGKEIWRRFGSQAGSRTLGRMAYAAGNSKAAAWVSSKSPIIGSMTSSGISSVAKSGFGEKKGDYESRMKEKAKNREALHKQIGNVDKTRYDTSTQKGRDALKKVEDKRRGYQADYRKNLPWGTAGGQSRWVGGVVGFMVDNRANRQTAAKLTGAADTQSLLKQEKDIDKNKNEAETKLKNLNAEIAEASKDVGLRRGQPATPEQLASKKVLEAEIDGYKKQLDKIAEAKEEARTDKLAGAFAEKTKKDDGGEKKPEEPKKP